MHEYRESAVARLMMKVDPNVSDVDLYVAAKMLEMCGIEPVPGGGALVGRSLVLGVGLSPFACGLGSRDFGHEVAGICFHASHVHQQNFWRNRLRSRTRFTHSTVKDLFLAMPVGNWDFVFVLPSVEWAEVSSFVLSKMRGDCKVVVAQRLPTSVLLENFKHEAIRITKAGFCHPATVEEGGWVIVTVR